MKSEMQILRFYLLRQVLPSGCCLMNDTADVLTLPAMLKNSDNAFQTSTAALRGNKENNTKFKTHYICCETHGFYNML